MAAASGVTLPTGSGRSRLRAHWRHLNGPGRIAGVDLARGLALVGMVAAHVTWIDEQVAWAEPATWLGLVHGNSSILFATLAGLSVGIVTGGSQPVTGAERTTRQARLLVRAAALWVIGIVLIETTVPVYVVLPAYAILFAVAAALVSLSVRALIVTAAAITVVAPFVHALAASLPVWRTPGGATLALMLGLTYPFVVWAAFVIAGLALARAGVTRLRVQLTTIAVGGALAVVGFALDATDGVRSPRLGNPATTDVPVLERVWSAAPHSSGILEVIASGGLALAIIAACALLCRPWRGSDGWGTGWVGYATLPLRAVGAMPLTAYTAHLLAWFAVALYALDDVPDLSGFRALEPFWPMTIGLVVGCTLWALLLGRGPLEEGIARLARRVVPGPR
ncbi:heparan-alpha-glucosaminide N-acetyltransferase domain-containing protein [Microbacter sp. GSS18]|nr:heparan-alpha-glucosaminide N-acetyltransferase domain-containing protein [Microbacter sp. GSS18]